MACLASLYVPRGEEKPNFDELVLHALKLPTVLLQDLRKSRFYDLVKPEPGHRCPD